MVFDFFGKSVWKKMEKVSEAYLPLASSGNKSKVSRFQLFWWPFLGDMVRDFSSKPEKCSKEGGKQKKKCDQTWPDVTLQGFFPEYLRNSFSDPIWCLEKKIHPPERFHDHPADTSLEELISLIQLKTFMALPGLGNDASVFMKTHWDGWLGWIYRRPREWCFSFHENPLGRRGRDEFTDGLGNDASVFMKTHWDGWLGWIYRRPREWCFSFHENPLGRLVGMNLPTA